jgi:hypothetical protein
LKKTDELFSSYFEIFIEQAKDFLQTKNSAVPGDSSRVTFADIRALLGKSRGFEKRSFLKLFSRSYACN